MRPGEEGEATRWGKTGLLLDGVHKVRLLGRRKARLREQTLDPRTGNDDRHTTGKLFDSRDTTTEHGYPDASTRYRTAPPSPAACRSAPPPATPCWVDRPGHHYPIRGKTWPAPSAAGVTRRARAHERRGLSRREMTLRLTDLALVGADLSASRCPLCAACRVQVL